eukprot:12399381-Karenia_brevis.AAC.1
MPPKGSGKKSLNTEGYLKNGYGPPEAEDTVVYRIPTKNTAFFNMRVRKGYEPILVRGGAWSAVIVFNQKKGKAEWVDAKKEYVMKHSGDKLS